jgi:hypothetical protein
MKRIILFLSICYFGHAKPYKGWLDILFNRVNAFHNNHTSSRIYSSPVDSIHDDIIAKSGQQSFELDDHLVTREERIQLTAVFIQELFRASTRIALILVIRGVLNSVSQTLNKVVQKIISNLDAPPPPSQLQSGYL